MQSTAEIFPRKLNGKKREVNWKSSVDNETCILLTRFQVQVDLRDDEMLQTKVDLQQLGQFCVHIEFIEVAVSEDPKVTIPSFFDYTFQQSLPFHVIGLGCDKNTFPRDRGYNFLLDWTFFIELTHNSSRQIALGEDVLVVFEQLFQTDFQ